MKGFSDNNALTPPATAASVSLESKLWQARCTATNDEEQAVSIDIAGPLKPKVYDNLPAAALMKFPVPTRGNSDASIPFSI